MELLKLAKKCFHYGIDFRYNGLLEMTMEPIGLTDWRAVLQGPIEKVEKRCKESGLVFNKEVYENGILVES